MAGIKNRITAKNQQMAILKFEKDIENLLKQHTIFANGEKLI